MKLKTVLIGLGRIGWKLELDKKRYHPCTHSGTLKYLSDKFELIGICDRNQNKINEFIKWWGKQIPFDTNYIKLISKLDSVDFAIIATNIDSHLEILEFLLKNQIPLILIEKPVFYSSKEIEKFLSNKQAKIYVNFERRYHPYYIKVKEIIERRTFGDLIFINGKIFSFSKERDPLLEDGSHLLDLILWYVGSPEILGSFWELDSNIEKRSYHILKKDNIVIFLESGGNRNYFEFNLTFDFQKGRIDIGNHHFKIYRKGISNKYEKFFELKEIKNLTKWNNPWINLYLSIFQKKQPNFYDAYQGILLYERLKKIKTNL